MVEENITYYGNDKPANPYTARLINVNSFTAATMSDEDFFVEEETEKHLSIGSNIDDYRVLVACTFIEESSDPNESCENRKYYWQRLKTHSLIRPYMVGQTTFVFGVHENYLGHPGENVGTMSPMPDLWRHDMPESSVRGFYAPKYKRRVLFSNQVELKISELPRWKPKVIIGKRTLEENNG